MDRTERKISKIERTAQQFTAKELKKPDLGMSEYDLIHCVRHNPGISQAKIGEQLCQDKAAIARRVAALVKKEYLEVVPDEVDRRGKKVFATEKAEVVKKSKVDVESFYYEWLTEGLDAGEYDTFLKVLDQLYVKSKTERKAGYVNVMKEYEK